MKEPDEIDSLFQSAFDGLTLTPDPFVKENIDLAIASKKKRRRFLFILFPVLFGAVGFAAMLYFYPFSESDVNSTDKYSKAEKIRLNPTSPSAKTASDPGDNSSKIINRENALLRLDTGGSERIIASTYSKPVKKRSQKSVRKNAILPPDQKTDSQLTDHPTGRLLVQAGPETGKTELKKNNIQANKVPEKPENNILLRDTTELAETKPDSTAIPATTISDSMAGLLPEASKFNLNNGQAGNWSLALLTYWEGEKKRTADLENEPFVNNKRETGVIHSSTFYGKLEINRKFARRWEVLSGIGFRSSNIVQYGYVDTIHFPLEGLGSVVPPITNLPDTVHLAEVQSFRVNSVVVPLGFAYSFPLKHSMRIRLAGGAEFAYGQFSRKSLSSELSAPTLRPFGFSVWVRPEFYYSFGRAELFGFGTFNQVLSQQLKWDFEPRRNPAFGGGIGLRIQL